MYGVNGLMYGVNGLMCGVIKQPIEDVVDIVHKGLRMDERSILLIEEILGCDMM